MANSTSKTPNRLINEKSPYLIQHAYSAVDWYPWGDEAFQKANKEDKPIFLNIGYSSCHWCHVMASEAFSDKHAVEVLNRDYVPVKVDREERPDIDNVYMSICIALTGSGGWPLNLILTPEGKPLFAGTYIPAENSYRTSGLSELLMRVIKLWKENKDKLISASEEIIGEIKKAAYAPAEKSKLKKEVIDDAFESLSQSFDDDYGGFGTDIKFPSVPKLLFLSKYASMFGNGEALYMLETTLLSMYKGGIFDHVGGGFCRYSTDRRWLVPHFEKMLYDNALLAYIYAETFLLTKNPLYLRVAERTSDYMVRYLKSENGGFYSSEDADSDEGEGQFYLFSPLEIMKVLGDEGKEFCKIYDIKTEGNFDGKSIPNLLESDETTDMSPVIFEKLRIYRDSRIKLFKDTKILTSQNCLAICAFSKLYRATGKEKYLKIAQRTIDFIEKYLIRDNTLYSVFYDNTATTSGFLDDYAYLSLAYIELYSCRFDAGILEKCAANTKAMHNLFYDGENGGYFFSGKENEKLVLPHKDLFDSSVMSGNSVAAYVFNYLYHLTGDSFYDKLCEKQLLYFLGKRSLEPSEYSFFNVTLLSALYPSYYLICTTVSREDKENLFGMLGRNLYPNLYTLLKTKENEQLLTSLSPKCINYNVTEGQSVYYLCTDTGCLSPSYSLSELEGQLKREGGRIKV